MLVAAIDPGPQQCGLVLAETQPAPVLCSAATISVISVLAQLWVWQDQDLATVLLERPAARGDWATAMAFGLLKSTLMSRARIQLKEVHAAEWKPVVKAQKPERPAGLQDRHQRDAWDLLWYWLHKEARG